MEPIWILQCGHQINRSPVYLLTKWNPLPELAAHTEESRGDLQIALSGALFEGAGIPEVVPCKEAAAVAL